MRRPKLYVGHNSYRKSGRCSTQAKLVCCCLVIAAVVYLLQNPAQRKIALEAHSSSPPVSVSSKLNSSLDDLWIPILAEAKIASFLPELHHGLSKKYRTCIEYQENRYYAMAKPFEKPSFVPRDVRVVDWERSVHKYIKKTDWNYQGWAEYAAFRLDRLLGLYKKLPTVVRSVAHSELFAYDGSWYGAFHRNFHLAGKMSYVALIAWASQVNAFQPTHNVVDFLLHRREDVNIREQELALDVSDVLVFDYLVDGAYCFTVTCH